MTRSHWWLSVAAILLVGAVLRTVWLTADPPPSAAVGIVWHDEGAWTHSARNRALWGVWRTDNWNPVFVAPVFTALEYGAFRVFGVGLWQARTVPVASGLAAIAALIVGLHMLRGRRAALVGGALLATNYVFVMWNRTAMMETTMTACLVAAWAATASSERRAGWGVVAGTFAVVAWFTKAAAAFFVAAIALNAVLTLLRRPVGTSSTAASRRSAWWTLGGLALAFAIIGGLFVLPHWSEYRFYNWQMSVTRKPDYSIRAVIDRISWLPLAHDVFSRSWPILLAGTAGMFGVVAGWQRARPAERLLVLWVAVGLAELVVHDSGNARRYVMFLPALAALSALWLSGPAGPDRQAPLLGGRAPWLVLPLVALAAYIGVGSLLRPWLQASIEAGHYRTAARLSGGLALALAALVAFQWSRFAEWAARPRVPAAAATLFVAMAASTDLLAFSRFARSVHDTNYEASIAVGRVLPPGTLVQGKLANGLALENRIKPIFIGNGFGNYEDRLRRDDIRFVLTYDLPRLGYESSDGSGLIDGLLGHYPDRTVVATFEVDETPAPDRAVLIDKFGGAAR